MALFQNEWLVEPIVGLELKVVDNRCLQGKYPSARDRSLLTGRGLQNGSRKGSKGSFTPTKMEGEVLAMLKGVVLTHVQELEILAILKGALKQVSIL